MAARNTNAGVVTEEARTDQLTASFASAAPHFLTLLLFPLFVAAALYGGWLLLLLFLFLGLNSLDPVFGLEERNMDPSKTSEAELLWYKLTVWTWAVLWPVMVAFVLWRVFAVSELAAWEQAVLLLLLISSAMLTNIFSHEFIHRRSAWERRIGEFLMASVSYPIYPLEHLYIHHARVCTPGDPESAPRGMGFWQFFRNGLPKSIVGSWRHEVERLARRQRPVWHSNNAFWRYLLMTGACYAYGWWVGGWRAMLVFVLMGALVYLQIRVADYIQHYGLRRILKPNGRFEPIRKHHGWSAGYRMTNWLLLNAQRHSDHHLSPNRRFPVLQHYGEELSPVLPGTYGSMMGLALFPKRWLETMNPILDENRARFYPQIDDWRPYDSKAFAERPGSFDAIAEILGAAPHLGDCMNRMPKLLDSLESREFTDISLPEGFGENPEVERIARQGLARIYWTLDLGLDEMKEQLDDIPVLDAEETADAAREWCNSKVFQIAMHVIRGNLAPAEALIATSRVADAALCAILVSVCDDISDSRPLQPGSGIAALGFGDLAELRRFLGAELNLAIIVEGGYAQNLHRVRGRFTRVLRIFARDNLLIALAGKGQDIFIGTFAEFRDMYGDTASLDDLCNLAGARILPVPDESGLALRLDEMRKTRLAGSTPHGSEMPELPQPAVHAALETDSACSIVGSLQDIERAGRYLQMKFAGDEPDLLSLDLPSIFRVAGEHRLIPADLAAKLASSAEAQRDLAAVLGLAAGDLFSTDSVPDQVRAFVMKSVGQEAGASLDEFVSKTTAEARACIEQIRSA